MAKDSLSEYRKKRDFRRTSEPQGGEPRSRGAPLFCVQQHDARRMHYDFRLEIDGVLKSWAVPKGPSLDPETKRLAVPTEDHPLDYAQFEGIIPKGQYGGGTVMLWDLGTFHSRGDASEAYERGKLVLELEGEKLRGGFTLVRTGDDAWLLRKRRDAFAKKGDEVPEKSVKTGRDLASIAAVGEPAAMPLTIAPALATLVEAPPEGDGWLHELKLDGYRVIARVEHGRRAGVVRLTSRSGQDWTKKLPDIVEALTALPDGVYDGEAVVFDAEGKTRFESLVEAIHGHTDAPITYALFDVLFSEGSDLRGAPLDQRKAKLLSILRAANRPELHYCDHVIGGGHAVFDAACANGVEGVV
ncbi:MAG: hypothetical protein H5U40_03105, partial [Polyangiaceae bacterium]|nr:hypothetical protein [Polyangiaceae bacterium]